MFDMFFLYSDPVIPDSNGSIVPIVLQFDLNVVFRIFECIGNNIDDGPVEPHFVYIADDSFRRRSPYQ